MMIVPIYAKVSIKRRKEYEKYKETCCFICIDCLLGKNWILPIIPIYAKTSY
jgi:hypothetical protein